jgi:D-alanyl-D-alanine carboxypeptidase
MAVQNRTDGRTEATRPDAVSQLSPESVSRRSIRDHAPKPIDGWLSKTPGIQYVAVNESETVREHAVGLADLSRQAPMNPSTTLMAYSMSKTITAVAVLQLVEAGKVSVDDLVTRHVDGLPYNGVTVRHLLSHTSGIPNPIPLRWVHPAASHAGFNEDAALAEVLRKHPRLAFQPGSRYRYSNIGYWLLGKVVERASGLPFADYIGTHIVGPLGLTRRDLGYAVAEPANHATGYLERFSVMNLLKGFLIDGALVGSRSGRWVEIRAHHVNGAAFGGLVGTARAFGAFLRDQLQPRSLLLGPEVRRLLYDPRLAVPGLEIPMTLGWHVGQANGERHFYKEGGGGGFHCLMRLYPDRGLGTVVMTNATAFPVRRLLDETD